MIKTEEMKEKEKEKRITEVLKRTNMEKRKEQMKKIERRNRGN